MAISTRDVTGFNPFGFLSGIKDEDLADILNQSRSTRLKQDETLFLQGDPARQCHLVLTGRLKLTKLHEQGKEAIVRYIESGEVTGAISVFRGKDYPVTARAVAPTEVVSWDKNTMIQLMIRYPGLALNMLQVAVDRLEDIQTRYLELLTEQVDQRIARALLRILQHGGRKTEGGIEISFPLSRQDLADYAGTTVYTVSRTLSAWEKKGWIVSGREKITLANPHALVLFAEKPFSNP
jgi:CRP/FNR family transcriptional regulator, nitrogen oxide reductase regulator